jgi:hypothetical protein
MDLAAFEVLAPFVRAGSYIDFTLGTWDGYEQYRWVFDGQELIVAVQEGWGFDVD